MIKKIKYTAILLIFTFPSVIFSSDAEIINDKLKTPDGLFYENKNSFKISLKKKVPKKSNPLIGTWKSSGYEQDTIIFLSENKLDYNGEILTYKLSKGIIRVNEEGENVDYPYVLDGQRLLITFPDNYTVEFKKVVVTAKNNSKSQNQVKNKMADCNVVHLPAEFSGGCNISLATPRPCEEIDLSYGKAYEFAWQTGGSYCETPYKFYIAGNPVTDDNTISWSFSEDIGKVSRKVGGIHYITAADLQGLRSNNGIYHWVVMGFYGSHPDSRTFRVRF